MTTGMRRCASLLWVIALACTPAMASAQRVSTVDFNTLTGVARTIATPQQLGQNIIQSIRASMDAQRSRYDVDARKLQRDQVVLSPDEFDRRSQALAATGNAIASRSAALQKLTNATYGGGEGTPPPAAYLQIRLAVAAAAVLGDYDIVVDQPVYRADQLDLTPRVAAMLRGQ